MKKGTELVLKKHVVLTKAIEVKHSKSSIILANEDDRQKLYLDDYEDHPLQGEVKYVGAGTDDYFPEGIGVGDIVYFDRPINPNTEVVNVGGELLARMLVGNIFMIKKKDKRKQLNKNIN